MKTSTITPLALALFSSLASAQVAVPRFVSTGLGNTEGFFVQAPVDLEITAVQVPDESAVGIQMVALYDLPSAPPSRGVSATPDFFIWGVASSRPHTLATPLKVKQGRWLCVLGGCGSTRSPVSTSVGISPFASSVLGSPVTLNRVSMANNIAASNGVGTLVPGVAARTLGRVLVFVKGAGESVAFGSGRSGGGRTSSDTSRPPNVSKTGAVIVTPGSGTNRGGYLAISLGTTQTPIPGWGTLYIDTNTMVLLTLAPVLRTGTTTRIPIPNNVTFIGQQVYFQAVLDKFNQVELTNGLRWRVGR